MLICVFLAFKAENFLTLDNGLNILRNVSMQGMIAFAMTMVIIAGEIDLSVGSAVAFSGCLTAWITQTLVARKVGVDAAVCVAMVASLAMGFIIGSLSGVLRVKFKVPTFISTLAWMTILTGSAELITNGFPLMPFPEWYSFLGSGRVLGIPFPVLVLLATFLTIQFTMSFTSFGRAIYAVGGNAEAARLSGISVTRTKILVMAIVALIGALAGIMQSAEIMSGSAITAKGWELDVISAVIIGGTSIMGGAGTVWGTFVGVVFLGVLVNGMTQLNVPEYWQHIMRGVLILAAVLINQSQARTR